MAVELAPGLQVLTHLLTHVPARMQAIASAAGVDIDADTEDNGVFKLRLRWRDDCDAVLRQVILTVHTRRPLPHESEEHFTLWFTVVKPRFRRKMVYLYAHSAAKAAVELLEILTHFLVTGQDISGTTEWHHLVAVK